MTLFPFPGADGRLRGEAAGCLSPSRNLRKPEQLDLLATQTRGGNRRAKVPPPGWERRVAPSRRAALHTFRGPMASDNEPHRERIARFRAGVHSELSP